MVVISPFSTQFAEETVTVPFNVLPEPDPLTVLNPLQVWVVNIKLKTPVAEKLLPDVEPVALPVSLLVTITSSLFRISILMGALSLILEKFMFPIYSPASIADVPPSVVSGSVDPPLPDELSALPPLQPEINKIMAVNRNSDNKIGFVIFVFIDINRCFIA